MCGGTDEIMKEAFEAACLAIIFIPAYKPLASNCRMLLEKDIPIER